MKQQRQRRSSPQTIQVLAALLDQPRQWRHGYDISSETGLSSGTLYPILMRLSDRGMLESKWGEPTQSGRPPRHLYRLTAGGVVFAREQLAQSIDSFGEFTAQRGPA
jgi:PadR family transcriptional regulator PadR